MRIVLKRVRGRSHSVGSCIWSALFLFNCWSYVHNRHYLMVVMHIAVFGVFRDAVEVEMHILKCWTAENMSVLQQWTSQMNSSAGKASPGDRACILATAYGNAQTHLFSSLVFNARTCPVWTPPKDFPVCPIMEFCVTEIAMAPSNGLRFWKIQANWKTSDGINVIQCESYPKMT